MNPRDDARYARRLASARPAHYLHRGLIFTLLGLSLMAALGVNVDARSAHERIQSPNGAELLQRALLADEAAHGAANVMTVPSRLKVARAAFQRGDLVTADALLQRNASIFDSNDAVQTNQSLAISLQEQSQVSIAEGRYDDAANQLQHAARLWTEGSEKRAYPGGERLLLLAGVDLLRGGAPQGVDGSTTYLSAAIGLAELLLDRGDVTSAHDLSVAFLARIRTTPEPEFLADAAARCRRMLGEVLLYGGSTADAAAHLEAAVALREQFDVAVSPWLAEARTTLAECRIAQAALRRRAATRGNCWRKRQRL